MLLPKALTLSKGFSNIALKKSTTAPPLSTTKFTKSLNAILTASNAVLNKFATFWFCINISDSLDKAAITKPIPAALIATPKPLKALDTPPIPLAPLDALSSSPVSPLSNEFILFCASLLSTSIKIVFSIAIVFLV